MAHELAWYSYWLNSKGLAALGVTRDSPDPAPGVACYVRVEIGSIEAGKTADLVVLDENLLEADRRAIHKVKPAVLMMEGKLMHGEW